MPLLCWLGCSLSISIDNRHLKRIVWPGRHAIRAFYRNCFSGIWLACRAFRGKVGAVQDGYGFLESDLKRISWVIGSGAAFILTFYLFGYFVAIIAGYTLMLLSFGVRDKLKILFSTLLMAIVFQWLFIGIMRLNDPSGALLDLRSYTNIISGE